MLQENTIESIQQEAERLYQQANEANKTLRFADGVSLAQKSAELWHTLHNVIAEADALNLQGICLWKLHQYKAALETYVKALALYSHSDHTRGIGLSYNNMANVFLSQKNYSRSIEYYNLSLDCKRLLNDIRGEVLTLNNIGMSYMFLHNYRDALASFERANILCERIDIPLLQAQIQHNIANAYHMNKFYTQALEHYKLSLTICQSVSQQDAATLVQEGIISLYVNIASVYSAQEANTEASEYALQALAYFEQHQVPITTLTANTLQQVFVQIASLQHAYRLEELYTARLGDITPQDYNAHIVRLITLALEEGDAAKALSLMRDFRHIDPNHTEELLAIAQIQLRVADYCHDTEQALGYAKQILALKETLADKERSLLDTADMIDFQVRMARQETRRKGEEFTRAVLNSALDAVVSIDEQGLVTGWNPQASVIFGWTEKEILGKRLSEYIIPLEYREAHERGMAHFIRSGEGPVLQQRIEITALHKQGTVFPVELTILPLKTDDGFAFTAFLRDISERKRAEQILRDYNAELKSEVEEQTRQLARKNDELAYAHAQSEQLLNTILPPSISDRLKSGENPIADEFSDVVVIFCDILGFTDIAGNIHPKDLIAGLNTIFTHFDTLAEEFGLEKIKTIGDSYMAVCGVPQPCLDAVPRATAFAVKALHIASLVRFAEQYSVQVRIGMHIGSVIAGVIGTQKFSYDLWGDTVNIAARMESHGVAGAIHVSAQFKEALDVWQQNTKIHDVSALPYYFITQGQVLFQERETIYVKGKGNMQTYFLQFETSV